MKKFLLLVFLVTCAVAEVGKITTVKGNASVERSVESIKAYSNMKLLKKDIVKTQDGRLQMYFNDNTVISLGKESLFVIKEYLYVNETDKAEAVFEIKKGSVKIITGLLGKVSPQMFTLETSAAVMRPHGTIWSVDISDDSERIEVEEGKVVIDFKEAGEETLEVSAGEVLVIEFGDNNKKTLKHTKAGEQKYGMAENKTSVEENIEESVASRLSDSGIGFNTIAAEEVNPEVPEPEIPVDDGNNGGGNDLGGVDPSNPGQGNP